MEVITYCLTSADFKVGITGTNCEFYHAYMSNYSGTGYASPSLNYNASTGILSFSNGGGNVYTGSAVGGYDNYVKLTPGGVFVIWLGTVNGR